jgi:hypothetical protein
LFQGARRSPSKLLTLKTHPAHAQATAKALNKEDVVAAVPAPMDQEEEREKVEDKQKGKDKA